MFELNICDNDSITNIFHTDVNELFTSFKQNKFNILYINARDIKNAGKIDKIEEFLMNLEYEVDVIIASETWIKSKEEANLFNIHGYKSHYINRDNRMGGGVGIFTKENLIVELVHEFNQVFYIGHIKVSSHNNILNIIGVYRPPTLRVVELQDFFSYLDKLLNRNLCKTIIVGDINLNIANCIDNDICNYISILKSYNFNIVNDKITRPGSGTLIDHVCVNFDRQICIHTFDINISDHNSLLVQIDLKITNETTKITKFQKTNLKNYKNDIESDIENLNKNIDYNNFVEYIKNKTALHSQVTINSSKINVNKAAWANEYYIKLIQRKNKLVKKFHDKPHNYLIKSSLINLQSEMNDLKNSLKNKFYIETFEKSKTDPKKMWSTLNKIIYNRSTNKKSMNIQELNNKNVTVKDSKDISNCLNSYFVNIGEELNKNNKSNLNDLKALGTLNKVINSNKQFLNTFKLTDAKEINFILKNKIKTDKSPGIDGITPNNLKVFDGTITDILVKLINNILETGTFPDNAKEALVCPIYKSGDRKNPNNYRPISLLPVLSKLIEHIIKIRLMNHFIDNNFLTKKQYGFIEKSDTLSATIDLTSELYNNINEGFLSSGVFLDMTKAFDLVPHDFLLYKLECYGLKNNALKLIESYLCNRKQRVKVNDEISDYLVIKSGVPQGSVLGPLLFVVYVNDIENIKLNGNISLYADDTSIFNKDKNADNLVEKTNQDLKEIVNFFKINRLEINEKKTQLMLFTSPQKKFKTNTNFIINNTALEPATCIKYLGLYFDPHLKWENHINFIVKSVAPIIGILFKLKRVIPKPALLNIYYSLVNSRLSYLNVVWCSGYKTSLNKLGILQNKAVKNIFNLPYRYRTIDLYTKYPLKSIDFLYKFNTIMFIRKNLQNRIHSNISFSSNTSNYETRNKSKIQLNNINNNYGKFDIKFNGAKLYNSLPTELSSITNILTFKKQLSSWLAKNINKI